jgi:CDP-4-dehydro-6-deoxyglucose reductase, E1
VGVAQLKKLPAFIEARKRNFSYLMTGLKDLEEFFVLPEATVDSDPSWFGLPLLLRENAPFSRNDLIRALTARKIGTRLVFGGNLIRQPAYAGLNYRVAGDLRNSDRVMNQAFWIGVYPGLTKPMLDYVLETMTEIIPKLEVSHAARN